MMSKMPKAYNFYKIWTGKFTHNYLLDFLLYGKEKKTQTAQKMFKNDAACSLKD